mgnify:CR=1 FL=1
MTDRQIEILRVSINGVHFYDDLDGEDRGVLMYLEREGYVYTKALDPPIYHITQKGLAHLKTLDDMAQKVNQEHSEKKAEQAKDRRFQLINTFVSAILGGVVTLVVEHFDSIIAFFQNLF